MSKINMKTLVFSDTHFDKRFDQRRFNKLADLIANADNVIINGDFWEGLAISFDEFMGSKWKALFPLLKAKKAIYVYGNHDDARLSDDRIYEFCDEAVENYTYKTPSRTYFFTHGQQFLFPKLKDKDSGIKRALKPLTKMDIFVAAKIQATMFKLFGPNIFPKRFNKMSLEERKAIAPIENLVVCGHSHKPQYQPDLNFIDIGFFNYGWANYMLIDDRGEFEFKSERY